MCSNCWERSRIGNARQDRAALVWTGENGCTKGSAILSACAIWPASRSHPVHLARCPQDGATNSRRIPAAAAGAGRLRTAARPGVASAAIAAECGFADQSHFTQSFAEWRALLRRSSGERWRRVQTRPKRSHFACRYRARLRKGKSGTGRLPPPVHEGTCGAVWGVSLDQARPGLPWGDGRVGIGGTGIERVKSGGRERR